MTGTTILFWTFSGIAVLSAILCISRRRPMSSALWLLVTLFCQAVLYVLLDAQFIAALQVLVYAGAIMVLFVFVIMLLNVRSTAISDIKGPLALFVAAALSGMLFLQLRVLADATPPDAITLPEGAIAALQREQGIVGAVATPLLSDYLIPFEITSLLLLAAIVGAVVLAKRKI